MAIFGAMIFFCFHGLNDMGKPRRDGGAFLYFRPFPKRSLKASFPFGVTSVCVPVCPLFS